MNDLAGSKVLANFADNLFGLATSIRAPHLRYIKQIKHRNTEAQYDTSNVLVLRLERMPSPATETTETTEPTKSSPPWIGGVDAAEFGGRRGGSPTESATEIAELTETDTTANSQPPTANPFLGFTFDHYAPERSHNTAPNDNIHADRQRLRQEARRLADAGHSERDIAHQLGISPTTAHRYLTSRD